MPRFWYVALMLFLGTFYGCYVVSVYKTVANVNLEDHLLTLAGSLGSACNGSSRIIWATLQDKFGFKKVYSCLLTLQLTLSASIYFVRKHPTVYVIWVCCTYLCYGGHFSMFPTLTARIFGLRHGGQIFTIMFFALCISSLFGFVLVQV